MSRRYLGGFITANPTTPTINAAPGAWTLNQQMQAKAANNWPIPFGDPFFNYTSLLLSTTALSNANNNLFVDSSGAFNPISRNGNTTQGSATPYGSFWSNYFDGSGDYFTVPYTTANFDWYTAGVDFTIEYWFLANSLTGTSYDESGVSHPTLIGNRSATATTDYWSFGPIASGAVRFYYFNGSANTVTSSATITANSWNHIAMTKTSSGITIFVNGVAQTTTAISGTPQSSASFPLTVGQGNNTSFNGYVSNLRIVRGTAIYSGNFAVPTTPLTAVTNTKLLTCQSNGFRDTSTNNLTLTVTGNTSVTNFAPFLHTAPIQYNQSDITNWSGYFDGNGDLLQMPNNAAFQFGTGDFCIEAWIYMTSLSPASSPILSTCSNEGGANGVYLGVLSNGQIEVFDYRNTALITQGGTVTTNQWIHVAATRSGSTVRIFQNGVQVASASNSANFAGNASGGGIGSWAVNNGGLFFNGYMSNVRVVKGSAVYTSGFTPSTTPLTAISGTSLLTLQNAAFTDNSTNNFILTPNGNVTVNGNSPFNTVGYWSLYGPSTAGATVPQTTATDLGSGSFTVECWVNLQNYTTSGIVTKRRTDTALTGSWGIFVNASGFIVFQGVGWASTYTATTNAIPLNTWTHIAVSRSGTNLSVYVNGVRVINATDSYDYTCSTYMIIKLAGNSGGNYPSGGALFDGFTGSISNLRIVQGTAVYNPASTTVTVPTSPLTAISGTSFLTLQNGTMKDNSTNNNTSILLYNSAASLQSFNPFYTSTIASNGGSMYFDGTGDYLRIPSTPTLAPGTGDFTWECWIYPINFNTGVFWITDVSNGLQVGFQNSTTWGVARAVIEWYMTSTTLPTLNSWNHIAVTRSGTNMGLFLNGSRIATRASATADFVAGTTGIMATSTGTFAVQGYNSNMRLVKGTAIYDPTVGTYTVPTAPANPTPATTFLANGMNAGAYDVTAINDMETVGNAQVSTAVSKFGGSSMYFDGTGDYLTSNAASDLYAFGTGDFTIEMWFNLSSVASLQILYDSRPTSTDGLYPLIYVASGGGSVIWQISAVARITGTATLSTGVWYHIAVSRSSGSTKMFLNGTQIGSTYADTNAYLNSGTTRPFIGGSSYTAGTLTVNGYIDDLRVTKGVARYTANFTPPTAALPTY